MNTEQSVVAYMPTRMAAFCSALAAAAAAYLIGGGSLIKQICKAVSRALRV